MDEDDVELIARLCTAAGAIMEDVSVLAISKPARDIKPLKADMCRLGEAAADILALVAAAEVVVRRGALTALPGPPN